VKISRGLSAGSSSLAMMFAGALAALTPAAILAISIRHFSATEQGAVAIAAAVGAFSAALANAAILESRLAASPSNHSTFVPRYAYYLGVASCAALVFFGSNVIVLSVCLPVVMVALQLGRTHAITGHLWRTELVAAVLLSAGIGGAATLVSVDRSELAFSSIALGALGSIIARGTTEKGRTPARPAAALVAWVTAETAVVASVPLVTNIAVLGALGSADAVAFRLVLSALGVLQPVLGYVRTRLLSRASRALVGFSAALSVLALSLVLLAHGIGIMDSIFGEGWAPVTTMSLVFACLWKVLTIPETMPFAALRRRGAVRVIFSARVWSSAAFLACGVASSAMFHELGAVFIAFCGAQIFTVMLYASLNWWDLKRRAQPI